MKLSITYTEKEAADILGAAAAKSSAGYEVESVHFDLDYEDRDPSASTRVVGVTVTLREKKPAGREPYGTTSQHCPKCESTDIINASQSLDCNKCGHSW